MSEDEDTQGRKLPIVAEKKVGTKVPQLTAKKDPKPTIKIVKPSSLQPQNSQLLNVPVKPNMAGTDMKNKGNVVPAPSNSKALPYEKGKSTHMEQTTAAQVASVRSEDIVLPDINSEYVYTRYRRK